MEENIIETTETIEASAKKGGKLKFIIISLLALVVVAIVVIVVVKPFDKESKLKPNEIKIGDKVYTFSAENGIDNFQDISSEDARFYKCSVFDAGDNELGYAQYNVNNGELYDGGSSDYDVCETAGWRYRNLDTAGGVYYQFYTEDGIIDWESIEADYNKVISEGTFENLDYYDMVVDLGIVGAEESDLSETQEYAELFYDGIETYLFISLAEAKYFEQVVNGEIDYFVYIYNALIGNGEMDVFIYSTQENVECIESNMNN